MENSLISLNKHEDLVLLFLVNEGTYQSSILKMIGMFSKRKIPGVYISVNKPFKTLESWFKRNKINTDLVIFIDTILLNFKINLLITNSISSDDVNPVKISFPFLKIMTTHFG